MHNIGIAGAGIAGLHLALRRKGLDTSLRSLTGDTLRVLLAAALMGAALWAGISFLARSDLSRLGFDLLAVLALIPLGVAVFFIGLRVFGLSWKRLLKD